MRKKFFMVLSVCVLSLLFAVPSSTSAFAETDSNSESKNVITAAKAASGEQIYTVQKDGINFTVTYPANIRCGTPTTFKFETTDASGAPITDSKYRIHSLMVHDGSEYVSVYDVSYGSNSEYTDRDTFDFTFYASGKYYIRFNTLYKTSSGAFEYMDTGTYERGIVLDISDSNYPSVETITDTVARECLTQCATDFDKAVWLNDWLVDKCSYDYSYTYCSAEGALARGSGTCEAYHRAYVMLLNKVGISTGRIVGNGHVWTAVKLDGKWYQVDTTWNDAGYTDPNLDLRHLYFGLNDDIMSLVHSDHKPVKGYESNSLESNYFIKSGEIAKWVTPQMKSVQEHISARETEFTLEIKNTNYADVLYSLVAHVLTNTSWSADGLTVELQAEYRPKYSADGKIDRQNGTIFCSAQYGAFQFQNIGLKADSVKIGTSAQLNYALNRAAVVTVQIYDMNNQCLRTLVSNASVGADSQIVQWDLKNSSGGYVANGSYYFSITAKDAFGNRVTENKYFQVTGNVSGAVTVYNGIDYSSVYDYNYYISKYSDLRRLYGNDDVGALRHFVLAGMAEGRRASENFDVQSYKNAYADLRLAYGNDLTKYYLHYIRAGKKEGRKTTGVTTIQNPITTYNGVNYAAVYDFNYYCAKNPDIKKAYGNDDIEAIRHFVLNGMKEGRQAKASFDVRSYRNAYADLRLAYGNDLAKYYQHYMRSGKKEGRKTTGVTSIQNAITTYNGVNYAAVYDFNYYCAKNPDIKKTYGNDDIGAIRHFVLNGMKEGRQAKDNFDVQSYKNANADLRLAYGNDLTKYYQHYMRSGKNEGRKTTGVATVQNAVSSYGGVNYSSVYNYNYYCTKNPDVKRAYGNDDIAVLQHFIRSGMAEGRQASQEFNVYVYQSRYPDVKAAYGNDLKAYYLHYMRSGKSEGRSAK